MQKRYANCIILLCILLLNQRISFSQQVHILTAGHSVSLRGLSVVNDSVLWVSGSAGTVATSQDGGLHWNWLQVPRYEKTDFRDIEAFSADEALIMGITEPAVILRTTDGGRNWKVVFEDSSKEVFLDALSFSANTAIVIGDPIGQKVFLAYSLNRGESWHVKSASNATDDIPHFADLDSGEAFFAASGTNLQPLTGHGWAGVTGGKKSSILLSGLGSNTLLMNQGGTTTGANSISINPQNPNEGYIVGGDFAHDTSKSGNALQVHFKPFLQIPPLIAPHGYRSCVEYLDARRLISCGTSGVDFSTDGGASWRLISDKGFHVCRRSKSGKAVFLAGAQGQIGRLESPIPVAGQ